MNFKEIVLSFLVFYCNYLQFSSGAVAERCGKIFAIGNVFGGQSLTSNPYKWIVAFRHTTRNKIFCAGSLISSKYVVSAAHCFSDKGSSSRSIKKPDDVVVLVGKNDLTISNEEGSKEHKVSMIINHEDWNTESYDFDADISLILLETEVDLSQRDYVGTVCLPPASQSEVTGFGTIVGWGINQHGNNLSTLNELKLPAVTRDECLDAEDDFVFFLSNRSFCAGFLNQNRSACQGDSGGGYFQFDRASRSFVLSGIISSALYDHYGKCRADTYSMFTSVGKFVDWIKAKMEIQCKKTLCTAIYKPVCAKSLADGSLKTFGNSCELNNANCPKRTYVLQSDGECPCPIFCALEYNPVCGQSILDGSYQKFGNICQFNVANCSSIKYIQVALSLCPTSTF